MVSTLSVAGVSMSLACASVPFGGLSLLIMGVMVGLAAGLAYAYDLALLAFMARTFPSGRRVTANALMEGVHAASRAAAPLLVAGILLMAEASAALALDALSYFLASFVVWRLGRRLVSRNVQVGQDGGRPPVAFWSSLRSGLALVRRSDALLGIAVAATWLNFFTAMVLALQPVFIVRALGVSASAYAAVIGLGSLAGIGASVIAPWAARVFGSMRLLKLSAALTGVALLLVPAMSRGSFLALGLVSISASGLGGTLFDIMSVSVRQEIVPTAFFARTTAILRVAIWGSLPLGAAAAGLMVRYGDLRSVLWVAALGASLSAIPLMLVRSSQDV
jgi:hypothetical protein